MDETPILRADATDDDLDEDKPDLSRVEVRELVCPICELAKCGHNLAYVMRPR